MMGRAMNWDYWTGANFGALCAFIGSTLVDKRGGERWGAIFVHWIFYLVGLYAIYVAYVLLNG